MRALTRPRALFAALVASSALACAAAAQTGEIVRDTVHSVALEKNLYGDSPDRSVAVYLPPSYHTSPQRRYPVVYLLHGFGGTENQWVTTMPVRNAMDSALKSGTAREMIVVMPNGRNRFNGSFYVNSASTGNWEDFISRELVTYIDRKYRTLAKPESRGLAGHSMGGFGTFAIGMRKSGDVYAALYALSGCCTTAGQAGPPSPIWDSVATVKTLDDVRRASFYPQVFLAMSAAFAPNPSNPPLYFDPVFQRRDGQMVQNEAAARGWAANSPIRLIPSSAERLKKLKGFMFDVGTSDPLVPLAQLAAMDTALTRAGVPHVFDTYDGNHSNRIAERLATTVLPFFTRTLDFGDGSKP
jgi:S-formylglutathione hydrolase FrmB